MNDAGRIQSSLTRRVAFKYWAVLFFVLGMNSVVYFSGKTWLWCESFACREARVCGGQRAVGSSISQGWITENSGCRVKEVRESSKTVEALDAY